MGSIAREVGQETATLQVWDSKYASQKRAFATYREGVCSSYMPWTPEPIEAEHAFEGRIESIGLGDCSLGISTTNGLRAVKSRANIAASPTECFYGNYILSGEMTLEQADRRSVARAGDLILYHSQKPIHLTEKAGVLNRSVGFCVPVSRFSDVPAMQARCLNTVVPGETLIEPLAACLRTVSRNLRTSSPDEIASVFDACLALLPMALGCFSPQPLPHRDAGGSIRKMIAVINDHLADPDLTPRRVAIEAGVSTRQLHKQFARYGSSFSSYVTLERLERVRAELLSVSSRGAPISELAYRWGFNDLSTFNRAFRRHFGVQPRSFRAERASLKPAAHGLPKGPRAASLLEFSRGDPSPRAP